MNWFEPLPSSCPPPEAEQPNGKTFYRLCANDKASSNVFCSQRSSSQNKSFAGVSECILRAVSIWESKEKCEALKKLPVHREKKVGCITLVNSDGVVLQTFKPQHFSWWRSNSFNPETSLILV